MEAGNGKSVKTPDVLAVADYINKAIPSDLEYDFAVDELVRRGYLLEKNDLLQPTKKSVQMYEKLLQKTADLLKVINLFQLNLDQNA